MPRFGMWWVAALAFAACTDPPPIRPPAVEDPTVEPSAEAPSAEPPAPPLEVKKISLEQKVMGTKLTMVAYTSVDRDETAVAQSVSRAFREIVRIEKLMSPWVARSELSQINAAAGGDPVAVGPDTLLVVDKSLWAAQISGGLFDITFEAMGGLWKFDEGAVEKIPPKDAILKAKKLIDYREVELDKDKSTVKLRKKGMKMNFGGIAKGYAVDVAARLLDAEGVKAFFIQCGGDLFVRGRKPDGSPFRVGIRDPRGPVEDSFAMLLVEDHAFSTAGDYERSFVEKGKRYHHIIDPRSGYPATASRSVTVWAKDALTADAIDDAVFIMGAEKGLELVESLDGVGAVIVDADNKVWVSKRLEGLVEIGHDPTPGI